MGAVALGEGVMNNEALISAHPIEPAMREQILDSLQRLEVDHDVKVLFACESGSRGWGFASPDRPTHSPPNCRS